MEPAPRRSPKIVEEPRRTPWPLIIGVTLAAIAAGSLIWQAASKMQISIGDDAVPKEQLIEVREAAPSDAPAAQLTLRADGVRPRWVRQPAPHYPAEAYDVPEASVRLICTIGADKGLENCLVIEETPAGRGFGRSAVASMSEARVSPDSSTGDRVDFSIRYVLPD